MDEELFQRILQEKRLQKHELEERLSAKLEEYSQLIDENSALQMIAAELGVSALQKDLTKYELLSQTKQLQGESVNFYCRVSQVYSTRHFERVDDKGNARTGKVCNARVSDGRKEATLVLWNQDVKLAETGLVRKNALLKVKNARVKSAEPLEFHTSLLTKVSKAEESELPESIPQFSNGVSKLADLQSKEDRSSCDFEARVLSVFDEKVFEKNGGFGSVAKVILADDSGKIALVFWNEDAKKAEKLRPGDALRVENASVRMGLRENEVHLTRQTHLMKNPEGTTIKALNELAKLYYPEKKLSELKEKEGEAISSAELREIIASREVGKCRKCGGIQVEAKAGCGKCGYSELSPYLIIEVKLFDDSGEANATFFGRDALDLLEFSEIPSIGVEAALKVKGEYLLGKKFSAVFASKNKFGQIELVARHLVK
jgi:replication factor A1